MYAGMGRAMSLVNKAMGLGLRLINRVSSSEQLDRLHLRKATERALRVGSRNGFRIATSAARRFAATRKLLAPSRLPRAASDPQLFDLSPSEEQRMLQDAAQRFAMEALRPAASEADSSCAAPAELLSGAAELGITLLGIPEELDGAGTESNAVTQVLIAEALAQGDMGLALACLAPSAVSNALTRWGDAEQQTRYLPSFAAEHAPVAALAVQEPQVLFNPFALQTSARREGEGFVLSGVKSLVPRAAQAELFIVAAQLEGVGPALFIVESGGAGMGLSTEPAMGLRAAATARLQLDRVKLPATALLAAGDAAVYAECISLSRIAWSALATGTAQAALDYLIPYVNERQAFGEPISHRQSVAFTISDISIELEGLRLVNWRAASRADAGLPFAREAMLARQLAAEKGVRIGSDAVQLLGGHGFVKEHPVERWYRDLRAAGMLEGMLLV